MEFFAQTIDDIIASLKPLIVDWKDETACRVIDRLENLPVKNAYTKEDVNMLLDENFDDGLLICRLFLGISKDQLVSVLRGTRGDEGIGVKSYHAKPDAFIEDLLSTGLLKAMAEEVNRKPRWCNVLIERLRSGRGSAIAGQRRGRGVEDFAEAIVTKVFGKNFQTRCTFNGPRRQVAKCDFAIPSKSAPRILIESKGYGATGSKMTDILGDIRTIIATKRPDTSLLFFTDGLTWKQRKSDLRKIVEFQNNGDITRIYTYAMADQFEADLRQFKIEYKL
jgi:DpnII restriction endonuclease.